MPSPNLHENKNLNINWTSESGRKFTGGQKISQGKKTYREKARTFSATTTSKPSGEAGPEVDRFLQDNFEFKSLNIYSERGL